MKALAYVRLSNRNIEETKEEIQKQKNIIHKWAEYESYKVDENISIEFIEDLSVSGKSINRQGLKDLIKRLKSGKYDTLVVQDISRLSRDASFSLHFFKSIIEKLKINFISLQENINTSTATGWFTFAIFAANAELYSRQISEKIISSNKRKKSLGLAIPGTTPYGYEKIGDKIVENESEQLIIKKIIELKDKGYTYKKIRKHLEVLNIKPPQGKYWYPSTIRRIYMENKRKTPDRLKSEV